MEKGKRVFTKKEFLELQDLICQLEVASPQKQKGIRNKLRSIGLYWSEIGGNLEYTNKNLDVDSFIIESEEVMKKYVLSSPEEIFPYLRTNFNSPNCFYRLLQDLVKDIDSSSVNNSEEKDV